MTHDINVGDIYRVSRDDITMVYLVTRVDNSVYFTLVYTKSGDVLENLRVYRDEFLGWIQHPSFVKL